MNDSMETDISGSKSHLATADSSLHSKMNKLYPELTEAELNVAEANLLRYFETVLAIADEQANKKVDLTASGVLPTIKERSIENLKK